MTAPSQTHEARRAVLMTLADLAGFTLRLPLPLPDGSIPDVAKTHPAHYGVFIGDAKDTESGHSRATQVQLNRYLRWARAASLVTTGKSIFAVCHQLGAIGTPWHQVIAMLADDLALDSISIKSCQLDGNSGLTWIALPGLRPQYGEDYGLV